MRLHLTSSTASGGVAALIASGPTTGVDTIQARGTTTASFSTIGFIDSGGTQRGSFGYAGTTASSFANTTFVNAANGVPLTLGTSSTERLRILNTGEIGMGTSTPSVKAALEISSTTRGFLPPRMTTAQRDAITSVPAGLMIYNTSTNKLNVYTTAWEAITSA